MFSLSKLNFDFLFPQMTEYFLKQKDKDNIKRKQIKTLGLSLLWHPHPIICQIQIYKMLHLPPKLTLMPILRHDSTKTDAMPLIPHSCMTILQLLQTAAALIQLVSRHDAYFQ